MLFSTRVAIAASIACGFTHSYAPTASAQSITTSTLVGRFYATAYVDGEPVNRNLDFTVTKAGRGRSYLQVDIYDRYETGKARSSASARLSHREVKAVVKEMSRIQKYFKRDLLSNFKPITYTYRTPKSALTLTYCEHYPIDRHFMVETKNSRGQRTILTEEEKDFRQVQKHFLAAERLMR